MMMCSSRLLFAAVMLVFFVSGIAGLIYEVVWSRYLALFLGHTSYAVVAVLVAFMGGLALGNAWLGGWADRARRPLVFYGWIEIGIGLYGLLFPFYYEFCHATYVNLARNWPDAGTGLLALKFAFGLLTVLLPTILMGGTLPILTRFITHSLQELRSQVAALYFINSAGAVAGCIIGDFWWIPAYGLHATVNGAAVMNLLVGAAALLLSTRISPESFAKQDTPGANPTPERTFTHAELRLAMVGIGLSGFVAMLYEVAWTRMLALVLGASTHAFSLMLITFITGIAVGSWLVGRWRTIPDLLAAFGWAELALGASLFISMFFYVYLPYWFISLAGLLARKPEAYPFYEFLQAMICFSVMLIPTICLGMTLPLVSRIATSELARTGRSVGRVFAFNTLGTVLGAALTGLWLMPLLGLSRTISVGITLNVLIAGAIFLHKRMYRSLVSGLAVLALTGIFGLTGLAFHSWPQAFSLGLWRKEPPTSLADYWNMTSQANRIYYRDGAGATVCVNSWPGPNSTTNLALKVNGKADASTTDDMPTQVLIGHIPMLLRPDSKQVLVIGLGSGVTCGAIATHPKVNRLDVVEILPEVAQAARLFSAHNGKVLDDPRLKLHVEDAKSFLQTTTRTYDVIASEPSNPWMIGVAGVFSREFFTSCRDHLTEDGLMAQWIHAYETSDEVMNMVVATFSSVFPNVSVWRPHGADLVLIGSRRPLSVSLDRLQTEFGERAVRADLQRIHLADPIVLLSLQIVAQEDGRFVVPATTPIHSDFHPRLEYVAQRAFFVRGIADAWLAQDETASTRPTTLLAQYLATHPLTITEFGALQEYFFAYYLPQPRVFRSLLYRWQQELPQAVAPIELAAQLPEPKSAPEMQVLSLLPIRQTLWDEATANPAMLQTYRKFILQSYRAHRSAFFLPPSKELQSVLIRLLETDPRNQRVYKLELAELAWDRGDDQECIDLAQSALNPVAQGDADFSLEPDPKLADNLLARVADAYYRLGKPDNARATLAQAAKAGYASPLLDITRRKLESLSPNQVSPSGDTEKKTGLAR